MKKENIVNQVDKALAAGADEAEFKRLAALSPIEYDRRRKEEAKKLGVTLSTLDREVIKRRAKQNTENNFLPHWGVEPWTEKVDGAALLADLSQQFTRYLVLPEHAAPALALWVLHTWVFECFDITPYLSITSPTKRCGKTVLMTLLYWLSCRGKKSDSMSKAAIYRSVEGEKPTLVLDEVGWVLDLKDDRQGILCGGFERNGYVEVCEGEGADITTRRFSTYCPKAFGLIGKLTATLTDRSICILMDRKPRTARVARLRRRDNDDFARLRQWCLRWANDNAKALAQSQPMALDWLNDRALDFWEPLLTIADQAGGDWPQTARDVALALSGEDGGDGDDVRVELLKDIRLSFGVDDAIRSVDLVAALIADPERPWADWRHGRGLTQKQLGGLLKPFGICSGTVGPKGAEAKGYHRWQFEEAWAAYCPGQNPSSAGFPISKRRSVEMPIKCREPTDFRSVEKGSFDGSKNCKLSANYGGFDASTDRKPKSGGKEGFDQDDAPARRPARGAFTDAKGQPTDDAERGYYGRQVGNGHHHPSDDDGGPTYVDLLDDERREYADWFKRVRGAFGQAGAIRRLKEKLDELVRPEQVQREIEHIKRMAEVAPDRRPALGPEGDSLDDFK
jgi:hypothetical protein